VANKTSEVSAMADAGLLAGIGLEKSVTVGQSGGNATSWLSDLMSSERKMRRGFSVALSSNRKMRVGFSRWLWRKELLVGAAFAQSCAQGF
jgi:hypothetical protein